MPSDRVRISLSREQAVELLTRVDDLVQLEREVPAMAAVQSKLQKALGLGVADAPE